MRPAGGRRCPVRRGTWPPAPCVTWPSSSVALLTAGSTCGEGARHLLHEHLGPRRQIALGGRERHRQHLAAGGAGRRRAVEDELHRAVDDGGEREVRHLAIEHEVHVDHGRGAQPVRVDPRWRARRAAAARWRRRAWSASTTASATIARSARRTLMSSPTARPSTAVPVTSSTPARSRAAPPRPPCASPSGCARPPDVGGVGPVEEAGAEDLDGRAEGGLVDGEVERRAGDQLPEVVDGVRRLAVVGQPGAEGDGIEGRVVGVEAAQRQRRPDGAGALERAQVPVPGQRRSEVERRRQRTRGTVTSGRRPVRGRGRRGGPGGGTGRWRRCGRGRRGTPCSTGGRRAGRCRTRGRCAGTTT